MKYYLYKNGMALYTEDDNEECLRIYIDSFPTPQYPNRSLLLSSRESIENKQEYLDKHTGECAWEVREYRDE